MERHLVLVTSQFVEGELEGVQKHCSLFVMMQRRGLPWLTGNPLPFSFVRRLPCYVSAKDFDAAGWAGVGQS
jgi:hypothetical protein